MRDWAAEQQCSGKVDANHRAETLTCSHGMMLIVSRFDAGKERHFHFTEPEDVVGIGFHLAGGTEFETEEEPLVTSPLDVWAGCAPGGSASRFHLPREGFSTVSIRMTPDRARELLEVDQDHPLTDLFAGRPTMKKLGRMDLRAAELTASLFNCAYTGTARRLFLESAALGLLAGQLGHADAPRSGRRCHRKRLSEARDYLDAHLANPPTIVGLARIVGLNDFKLKREFKRVYGTTIFGYVRERRLHRAAADLLDGMPVQEAAHAAGYESPRCFAEAFRRHYGILPSKISRRAFAEAPAWLG